MAMPSIERREFLRLTITVLGAGAAAAACSSSGSSMYGGTSGGGSIPASAPAGDTCAQNGGKNGTITGNHGHSLVVPKADFATPETHTYGIQGTAMHNHQITLTAQDLQTLLAGEAVVVTSTTDLGHSHDVQVICA